MDANFLRGLLEQEGIRAVVQGEALQETWGGLNLTSETLPSVWVDEVDVERAIPIVEEYKRIDAANADAPDEIATGSPTARKEPDQTGTWVCANCGRVNEPQFDRCWNCTHPRNAGPILA